MSFFLLELQGFGAKYWEVQIFSLATGSMTLGDPIDLIGPQFPYLIK